MTPSEKVTALRAEMKKNNIAAFVVYSADPHLSEYLPEEWQEREWLSGFTGSAGFVVITPNKAGLWTDGRYFTQANKELAGSGITLYKLRVPEATDYKDWLVQETPEGSSIAVNAQATAHAEWESLQSVLAAHHRTLIDFALLDKVWKNRPTPRKEPIFVHPLEWAGKSVPDKLSAIRDKMKGYDASLHLIAALDDVAWTTNLRGSDVDCNPVFKAYLAIAKTKAILFVDESRMSAEAKQQMKTAGIDLKPYTAFFKDLESLTGEQILLSGNCNQAIFQAVKANNQLIVAENPGNLMKAVKNKKELEGFREVMVRDGVAMVKFLYWLTHKAGKMALNEYEVGQKLYEFRAAQKNFVGESFATIAGFKENGAIIHYKAPAEGSKDIVADGSILVDSGGQYLEGTTDITRTFPLGKTSEDFKHDYTLVMKAHIDLAMARFPENTRGAQVDILARLPLWEEGKDFNHGTGHGVGSFLNVHEGPQSIRKEYNPHVLVPGMVMSNEPGYYIEGQYAIRHENLMVVKPFKTTEWNDFYAFETITLCPFFKTPLKKELLSEREINWFNTYQQRCREKLSPFVEGEVKEWLIQITEPL